MAFYYIKSELLGFAFTEKQFMLEMFMIEKKTCQERQVTGGLASDSNTKAP